MKSTLTLFLLLAASVANAQFSFFETADRFFGQYVVEGRVDYRALHTDGRALDSLVHHLSTVEMSRAPQEAQVAFYVNAYNLLVIQKLTEHYPATSPKNIAGFFDQKMFNVGGKKMSLNTLEHTVLAGVKPDPRYHFALVCGALGCPKLAATAPNPETVNHFLDARTQAAMDDVTFIRKEGDKVLLSQIFKWYAKDFGGNPMAFINQYRTEPLALDAPTGYYDYDWTTNALYGPPPSASTPKVPTQGKSNVQTYTPSVLLKKGQSDLTVFNSIYTQTKSNWLGQDYSGSRETFAGSWIQYTRGVSKNARINVGFEINLKASSTSADSTYASITDPFAFKNDASHRVGITTLGPKVKIAPFKGITNFSIESIFWIPVGGSTLEGARADANNGQELYFLDWNRLIWWNRFYFDKSFGQFQFFTEADLLFRFPIYDHQKQALDIPISAIFSYFPSSKTTVYVLGQHVNRYRFDTAPAADGNDLDAITTSASYSTWGAGGKYQLTPKVQVEVLYTNFWRGVNSGLGETFNLGVKTLF